MLNVLVIAGSAICVVTSVFMLIGICVESHRMLIPWIIAIVGTTCLDTVLSIALFNDHGHHESVPLATIVVMDVIQVSITFYGVYCVSSEYRRIRDKSSDEFAEQPVSAHSRKHIDFIQQINSTCKVIKFMICFCSCT